MKQEGQVTIVLDGSDICIGFVCSHKEWVESLSSVCSLK